MRRADLLTAAALVVIGMATIFVVIPMQTSGAGAYGLPPALFPTVSMAVVTGLAALLFAASVRRREPDARAPTYTWSLAGRMGLVTLALLGCIAVTGFTRLDIGGALTVSVFMLIMGERRPLHLIAAAVVTGLFIYVAVGRLLHVTLG